MYIGSLMIKRNWSYKSQKLHVCKLVIKYIDNIAVLCINRLSSIVSNIRTYPGRNLITSSWLPKNFLTVPNGNNYISITKLRTITQSIWPTSIFLFIKPLIDYPFVLSRELRKKIFTLHSLLYYAHSDRCVMKNKNENDGKERETDRQRDRMFSMRGISSGNEILWPSLSRSKYISIHSIFYRTISNKESSKNAESST